MNIIIDTKGQADLVTKTKLVESDDDCDLDDIGKLISLTRHACIIQS